VALVTMVLRKTEVVIYLQRQLLAFPTFSCYPKQLQTVAGDGNVTLWLSSG
jgi:hypothetical protein